MHNVCASTLLCLCCYVKAYHVLLCCAFVCCQDLTILCSVFLELPQTSQLGVRRASALMPLLVLLWCQSTFSPRNRQETDVSNDLLSIGWNRLSHLLSQAGFQGFQATLVISLLEETCIVQTSCSYHQHMIAHFHLQRCILCCMRAITVCSLSPNLCRMPSSKSTQGVSRLQCIRNQVSATSPNSIPASSTAS